MTKRTEFVVAGGLSVRDEGKREIEAILAPYDTIAETTEGLELLRPGAFAETDVADVRLRMDHENPAGGRGVSLEERDGVPVMVLRAAKTARGDEMLAAASDPDSGYQHVSVGFEWIEGAYKTITQAGRRVTAHSKVKLREVSLTWRPAYAGANVLSVRSEEEHKMDEAIEPTTESPPAASPAPVDTKTEEAHARLVTELSERLGKLEERERKVITLPELMRGKESFTQERRVLAVRELAEVITTDNLGVVPDATSSEMIGIIDSTRPFLGSTRQLPTPAAGMNLIVPKITQRPLVGKQAAEKDEVASRKTIITAVDFPFETYAGAADLSIQLIKRSSPEFLSLWLELLGEAYAIVTENAAVDALLAETAVVEGTATFDPATGDISFGEAFTNTQAISPRLFPDTLWLSTAAVAAMIDAKTDGTNVPMFGDLALNADANGGVSGKVSGLNAVHVPALDDEAVDAIVGPRRGFAWAEDGTYTLQADIPSKAGRDVGIVGMIAYATWYPAAFTTYALES